MTARLPSVAARLPSVAARAAYEKVCKSKQEVCGSFDLIDGELMPKNCFDGYMEDGRYVCERKISTVTPYTFHTHIWDSPGYPSTEDLLTLVEEDKILDVIYTCWGIWIVTVNGPVNKQHVADTLHVSISPFNGGIDRLKKLSPRVKSAIDTFIKIMKENNYNIKFYSWQYSSPIKINIG